MCVGAARVAPFTSRKADHCVAGPRGNHRNSVQPLAVNSSAIGDLDGVVVVKRETAADVLKLATVRIEDEVKKRRQLGAGELGVDVLGLRAKLKDLGVEYID